MHRGHDHLGEDGAFAILIGASLFTFFRVGSIGRPLAHPVVTGLGFDGIWFGMLTVSMIELGLITVAILVAVPGLVLRLPGTIG